MSENKFFVGYDLTGFADNGIQKPISRVTLLADDENVLTAGDDSGMELLADCPHATQAMVNAIYNSVKGMSYKMFTAENARLDPAAELGDGVTAGRVYSVISRLSDDGNVFPGITAPGQAELQDEYPAGGPMTQSFNRKIAETRSTITKTAEQIRLEVTNEVAGLNSRITIEVNKITQEITDTKNGLESKIEQTASSLSTRISNAEGNISTLEQTANSLRTRISSAENNISSIEQYVDSITLSVSNGQYSSTLKLMAGRTTLASEVIEFTGMVTFSDLQGNRTIINGSTIDTSTLYLDTLYGGTIYLRDNAGRIGASFEIVGANSLNGRGLEVWSGETHICTYTGELRLRAQQANILLWADNDIQCSSDLVPYSSGYDLGSSSRRWGTLYTQSEPSVSSDRTLKKDIYYGLDSYDAFFDSLRPVSYKLINGESGRTHIGLISQDVERSLIKTGLTDMDFAGFIRSPKDGVDGYDYSLRYGEFIALCIEQIQRLKIRVFELERRLPQ